MILKRAYSILKVKSVEDTDEERVIKGIATTPSVDRVGDEVDPMGAQFKTPMPLLLHHDHTQPVGTVTFAKATKEGIPFEARIAKVEEAGKLKERTDEAWQSVKHGLIAAVSIGFSALDYITTKTGLKFTKWEWHELSLVTVPANAEATITAIKSLDQKYLRASSQKVKQASLKVGDTTSSKTNSKKETKMKKYADKIAQIKAKLSENLKSMEEMQEKSFEDGETFSAEDTQEFETLQGENDALEAQLKSLEYLQSKSLNSAVEVKGQSSKQASESRTPAQKAIDRVSVKGKDYAAPKEEKGLQFARVALAVAKSQGNMQVAEQYASQLFSDNEPVIETVKMMNKAAVAIATNQNPAWAGNLIPNGVIEEFLEFQEPQTIMGRLPLRQVAFYNEWVEDLDGGDAGWVGELGRKPFTQFALRKDVMVPHKLAAIAAVSDENVIDTNGRSLTWIRDSLARALSRRQDLSFLDPTFAGVTDVAPASITYGVAATPSTGDAQEDVEALILAITQLAKSTSGNYILTDTITAQKLTFLRNTLTGQYIFPELATNGSVLGVPVLSSDYLAQYANSSGRFMVAIHAPDIAVGYSPGAPGLLISYSNEATLVPDDNQGGSTPAAISMFQNNGTAVRVEKRISWKKKRTRNAVVVIDQITW